MQKNHSGFTLIEIAIVLVIIGLLLGGVLKGQELINNAKVRNIISQQDSYKAAFFAFQDRFRALPGDYSAASTNIPGIGSGQNGNGNNQISKETSPSACDESIVAWAHLTRAGFISGSLNGTCTDTVSAANSPTNPYGGIVQLIFDNVYSGTATQVHNIKTGNLIPVSIISEIDRKIDDGGSNTGIFRFSTWGSTAPTEAACLTAAGTGQTWNVVNDAKNCGGAYLF